MKLQEEERKLIVLGVITAVSELFGREGVRNKACGLLIEAVLERLREFPEKDFSELQKTVREARLRAMATSPDIN